MILDQQQIRSLKGVRAAQAAVHFRGYTAKGDKLWSSEEDHIVRQSAHMRIPEAQQLLPGRSKNAIERRRTKLAVNRRRLRAWTTVEDRKLRENIDRCSYVELSSMLPGRSMPAIQGRAWYLGFRKGVQNRPLIVTGIDLIDRIRARAKEDGITLRALDDELGSGKYFRNAATTRRLNLDVVRRAVEFFGGKLTIDWQDE